MMIVRATEPESCDSANNASRDDTVLWCWPAGRWEWHRAGAWVWGRWSVAMLGTGLGIAVGAGMMTNAYLLREDTASAGAMLFGASTGLLIGAVLVLAPASILYAMGCLFVPRLVLTGQDIRVESHVPWRRSRTVPRSEVLATVIYEGDGTVVLVNNSGSMLRVRHVRKAAAFAEALGAPALAWPVRKQNKTSEILTGAEMACFFTLTFAGCVAALILVNIVAPQWFGYFLRVCIALVTGPVLGIFLATTPVLAIGRHFVTRESLDEFLRWNLDRARWLGRKSAGWDIFATGTRIAIRILRITPPPPLEPELRHGATLGLAAALAAREGSAS